jgi:hypothetical protein
MKSLLVRSIVAGMLVVTVLPAAARPQEPAAATPAQPAYEGPGRSKSETIAILYIKTLVNAQREYKKRRGKYATTLPALINHGSFTKRMSRPDRGEYQVKFSGNGTGFWVVMQPKEFTPERRSFYADATGHIRAQENEPATGESPLI